MLLLNDSPERSHDEDIIVQIFEASESHPAVFGRLPGIKEMSEFYCSLMVAIILVAIILIGTTSDSSEPIPSYLNSTGMANTTTFV